MQCSGARIRFALWGAAALLVAIVGGDPGNFPGGAAFIRSAGVNQREADELRDEGFAAERKPRSVESFVIPLRRIWSNGKGKCMDGSRAGFYIRRNEGSKKWVVFLEGGSYCFDLHSCRVRAMNSIQLTSSNSWLPSKPSPGILSSNPEENPFSFFSNAVFVPYCSGDAWTGNSTKRGQHFNGAVILEDIVLDLLRLGLNEAKKLFLVGGSAGATGVLINVDRVAAILQSHGAHGISVFGIIDSGWFVDAERSPTAPRTNKCNSLINCPPLQTIKKGYKHWNAQLPQSCVERHSEEPWQCFFGPRLYPHIRSPIFIIHFLYDSAQIIASVGYEGASQMQMNVHDHGGYRNPKLDQYVHRLAQHTNNSLQNVTAVFSMSCYAHELLLHSYWHRVRVRGRSIVETMNCWEESQEVTNRAHNPSWRADGGEDKSDNELVQRRNLNSVGTTATQRSGRRAGRLSETADAKSTLSAAEMEEMASSNRLQTYRRQRLAQCQAKMLDDCDMIDCNPFCPAAVHLSDWRAGSAAIDRAWRHAAAEEEPSPPWVSEASSERAGP